MSGNVVVLPVMSYGSANSAANIENRWKSGGGRTPLGAGSTGIGSSGR